MNPDVIATQLEAASNADTAAALAKQVHTLRGLRGVPTSDLAKIIAQAWKTERPQLPRDEDALGTLYGNAWEDGIVAIGLLSALVPDSPQEALDIAAEWLERIDDVGSADALGWLVLGPATLASGGEVDETLGARRQSGHPAVRRAAVMAGMAMTPELIEGPAAAALRERLGTRDVQFVEAALSDKLSELSDAFLRDEDPSVRKALRRVLGAWALSDPDAAEDYINGVRGGVPKMLREEVEKAARKGRRRMERTP